jgi:hypothetical protein
LTYPTIYHNYLRPLIVAAPALSLPYRTSFAKSHAAAYKKTSDKVV